MQPHEKDQVFTSSSTISQGKRVQISKTPTRSASICIPVSSIKESNADARNLVGLTGPLQMERKAPVTQMTSRRRTPLRPTERKEPVEESCITVHKDPFEPSDRAARNVHLMRSGQLGLCNDPYCTTCPTSQHYKVQQMSSVVLDPKLHRVLYGDAKGWVREKFDILKPYVVGVMNPHAKVVQRWNQFLVISCSLAIFIDPLFFYLLTVEKDKKCVVINWPLTIAIVAFRSITDLIFLIHMLLQFRLAFISPESRVVGAGDLVDQPKKIAHHYLSGYFGFDMFIVLPLPQIIVLVILPNAVPLCGANDTKNLLRTAILVQYMPRLYRFLHLLAGQSPSGFVFESAWGNFVINLLIFILSGHVVGSCWYLFGLQRVNQCFRDACHKSGIKNCLKFIDCGHGDRNFESDGASWENWKNNANANACFDEDGFPYGIYKQAVNLTTVDNMVSRYLYSLVWGFQFSTCDDDDKQLSTLAGSLTPSYYVWEVLFTMVIIGLGLLLFALLIGNMQNFLQGLGRRRLELSLRRRDVEQWMSHRRLPADLRRKVRESERYSWAASRGVNEEVLMENLPEDVQREIRRHLFKFVKKVRIFALMDEPILDAICERLRQKTYIEGGTPLYHGGLLSKMIFIVRGKMESIGEDGDKVPLSVGDVCGEELLSWCLEHSSVDEGTRKLRKPPQRLLCNRTVECLTNVETFVLRATDLEEVTSLFATFLKNPRIQVAIRNKSPYWRGLAASCIQVAWRYRKMRLSHPEAADSYRTLPSKFRELLL